MSAVSCTTDRLKRSARAIGVTRANVARARFLVERTVLAAKPRRTKPRDRILCYHAVGTPEWGINDLAPAQFRRQLQIALDEGYEFVPASEIATHPKGGKRLAVTFDDGLRSVVENAEPILADLGIPWTMFVVCDWADGCHETANTLMLDWDEVGALATRGIDIGSHSLTHPNFAQLPPDAVARELESSHEQFHERIGLDVNEFAIPLGASRHWPDGASATAMDAGYAVVYAESEDLRPADTIGRTMISGWDSDWSFQAALDGAYDRWEE